MKLGRLQNRRKRNESHSIAEKDWILLSNNDLTRDLLLASVPHLIPPTPCSFARIWYMYVHATRRSFGVRIYHTIVRTTPRFPTHFSLSTNDKARPRFKRYQRLFAPSLETRTLTLASGKVASLIARSTAVIRVSWFDRYVRPNSLSLSLFLSLSALWNTQALLRKRGGFSFENILVIQNILRHGKIISSEVKRASSIRTMLPKVISAIQRRPRLFTLPQTSE